MMAVLSIPGVCAHKPHATASSWNTAHMVHCIICSRMVKKFHQYDLSIAHMGLQQRSPYLFGKYLFKPGDLLFQCGCFVVSLGLSRQVAGFKLKLSYGHFLPHRFQCAIYDEHVIWLHRAFSVVKGTVHKLIYKFNCSQDEIVTILGQHMRNLSNN